MKQQVFALFVFLPMSIFAMEQALSINQIQKLFETKIQWAEQSEITLTRAPFLGLPGLTTVYVPQAQKSAFDDFFKQAPPQDIAVLRAIAAAIDKEQCKCIPGYKERSVTWPMSVRVVADQYRVPEACIIIYKAQ